MGLMAGEGGLGGGHGGKERRLDKGGRYGVTINYFGGNVLRSAAAYAPHHPLYGRKKPPRLNGCKAEIQSTVHARAARLADWGTVRKEASQ